VRQACHNTLLCRFFGLHRLKHSSWGKLYLIIMSNIFDTDRVIHTRYDLKGSTVGRKVSEFEKKQVPTPPCPPRLLGSVSFLSIIPFPSTQSTQA